MSPVPGDPGFLRDPPPPVTRRLLSRPPTRRAVGDPAADAIWFEPRSCVPPDAAIGQPPQCPGQSESGDGSRDDGERDLAL
jgi:hypothetical protein